MKRILLRIAKFIVTSIIMMCFLLAYCTCVYITLMIDICRFAFNDKSDFLITHKFIDFVDRVINKLK